jgi:hypothetical protein
MIDPEDFISSDEGYRDTDWDSHLKVPEAFYTEALPCECCGHAVDERRPATWNAALQVGTCCYNRPSVPNLPACPGLYKVTMSCESLREMLAVAKAHKRMCPECGGLRKGPSAEIRGERKERAA